MMDKTTKIKRLYYLSNHRGCKETDVLLGPWAEKNLENLSDHDLELYESLLQEPDWDIFAWATGAQPLPEKYRHTIIEDALRGNSPS